MGTSNEDLMKVIHDFKEANTQRLEEVEKSATATADGIVTERVEKLNARIDELADGINEAAKRAEKAELTARRTAVGGVSASGEISEKHLREFSVLNKGGEVSEQDYRERSAAMNAYLRKGREDGLQAKGMSVDSDPEGGYYVMPDTSGRTVQFVFETSPMRQVAAVQTITTDALEGFYDLNEAGSGWVGERASRPETSTPDIGKYRIPVHELYAEPRATQKLLDDSSVDIEAWLSGKVADKFARAENAAFISGDGIEKPRGVIDYAAGTPTSSAFEVIQRIPSGASGAFPAAPNAGDPLIDTVFALKAAYRNGAVWMMNRSVLADVRKLTDSDGQYLWSMSLQDSGLGMNLLGFPVVEAEDLPDRGASANSILFGNFAQGYQIVDRLGIRVLRDPFTAKPFVKFYSTKRTGGAVINFEAIKIMQFGA